MQGIYARRWSTCRRLIFHYAGDMLTGRHDDHGGRGRLRVYAGPALTTPENDTCPSVRNDDQERDDVAIGAEEGNGNGLPRRRPESRVNVNGTDCQKLFLVLSKC